MLGILKSKLIHLEGLFPASHWLDINIYQKIVKHILLPEERILADVGRYRSQNESCGTKIVENGIDGETTGDSEKV